MPYQRYTRAEDLLPPELVEQIHEHFRGGYLYVPTRKSMARIKRDLEIFRMFNEGRTVTEIAETFLITRAGVRQVLKKRRWK
jgi:Mor family transcriptional regulator